MQIFVDTVFIGSDNEIVYIDVHNAQGVVRRVTLEQLKVILVSGNILSNAVLTKSGVLRAKSGSLRRVFVNTKPNMVQQSDKLKTKKLFADGTQVLYHGTKNPHLVPRYGVGKSTNDYGSGFYTTADKDLACEWAWSGYTSGDKAYCYGYSLDSRNLNILNLTELNVLHWVAELIYNRSFSVDSLAVMNNKTRLLESYKLDMSKVDIIIGYRADDRYFNYISDFLSNSLYLQDLERAMRLGDLGIQVFIKSKLAFSRLVSLGKPELVSKKYKDRFYRRDSNARRNYDSIKSSSRVRDGILLADILRKGCQ